jgi:ribosomal protein L37AE/L43A
MKSVGTAEFWDIVKGAKERRRQKDFSGAILEFERAVALARSFRIDAIECKVEIARTLWHDEKVVQAIEMANELLPDMSAVQLLASIWREQGKESLKKSERDNALMCFHSIEDLEKINGFPMLTSMDRATLKELRGTPPIHRERRPDETCQECGTKISRRAKVNIWQDEKVVCTSCLHELESAVRRHEFSIQMGGKPHTPWLVDDGKKQHGPYSTAQVIQLLDQDRVDWLWKVWREGMSGWKVAAMVFNNGRLSNGQTELRYFGQGDGTYKFEDHINKPTE